MSCPLKNNFRNTILVLISAHAPIGTHPGCFCHGVWSLGPVATDLQLGSWRKREFCQQGWDREPVTIYWNNIFIDDKCQLKMFTK